MSPNPYIPSTIAPMQVPLATVISEDAFTFLFRPGSPLQKIPHSQLLAKLISTDLSKVSKSLLDADLAWIADKVALVHNDPTALLNGWYRKTGASGAGGWVQFETLALATKAAAEAAVVSATAAASAAAGSAAAAASGATAGYPTIAQAAAATIPVLAQSLRTGGYSVAGDGGDGLYKRVTAQPTHLGRFRSTDRFMPDGSTNAGNGGWWELVPQRGQINVRQFGAKGDGATDEGPAFAAAFEMFRLTRTISAYSDPLTRFTIFVPGGEYLIAAAESILPASAVLKSQGFVLQGAGIGQTQIVFTAASGNLLSNAAYLICDVRDIAFVGTTRLQTFYRCDMSANAQQGWTFQNCIWKGIWNKGFHLTGSNNNSEYSFINCRGSGEMGDFLYTPSTGASDQHLNFRFIGGNYWFTAAPAGTAGTFTGSITAGVLTVASGVTGVLAVGQTIATPAAAFGNFSDRIAGQEDRIVITSLGTGAGGTGTYNVSGAAGNIASTTLANLTDDANCLINMAKGGAIHFEGADFSGWNSGTLFKLRGATHASGVCHFSTVNCRYEMKSPNVHVLYSEWPQGSVSFTGDDYSSQASLGYFNADGTVPIAWYIAGVNVKGARYLWKNCSLIGKFSFAHATNDFEFAKSVKFEDCDFEQFADIFDAFIFPTSTNDYGNPHIQMENCRNTVSRVSTATAWAAATVYALNDVRKGPAARSLYKCTTAGTSAVAASTFTFTIAGTVLTVTGGVTGALGVGQTISGVRNASVTADITVTSAQINVTALGSGQLAVGQVVAHANLPVGTTITSFGTYAGATGTVNLSAAATATALAATVTARGQTILTDTVITSLGTGTGGTGTYNINRSQTALTQTTGAGTGGPQSAAASIPDGTAVWTFVSNNNRDYFNDGSPLLAGQTVHNLRPHMKRQIAVFGYQLPTANPLGLGSVAELILPPNATIVNAGIKAPANGSGGVSSGNPADYLIECDDGTALVKQYSTPASSGFSTLAPDLFIQTKANMQKRKVRLVAGGVAGATVDQANSGAIAWIEYLA